MFWRPEADTCAGMPNLLFSPFYPYLSECSDLLSITYFLERCTAELMNCCKGFHCISSIFRRRNVHDILQASSTVSKYINHRSKNEYITHIQIPDMEINTSNKTCLLLLIMWEENITGVSASPSTLTLTLLNEVTSGVSSRLLFLRIIQCGEK